MDTLGKFKTNFLKDRSSFKIGFNNRSPLSNLKGSLDGGIKSASSINIPKLKSTIGKDGGSILVQDDGRMEAAGEIGAAIGEAGKKIGEAIEKKQLNEIVDDLPGHFAKWQEKNPNKDIKEYEEKYRDQIKEYVRTHETGYDHQGRLGLRKKKRDGDLWNFSHSNELISNPTK
jgi:hypothetical protein